MNKPSPCQGCLEEQSLRRQGETLATAMNPLQNLPAGGRHIPIIAPLRACNYRWIPRLLALECKNRVGNAPWHLTNVHVELSGCCCWKICCVRVASMSSTNSLRSVKCWDIATGMNPSKSSIFQCCRFCTQVAGLQEPIPAVSGVKAGIHPGRVTCSLQDPTERDK